MTKTRGELIHKAATCGGMVGIGMGAAGYHGQHHDWLLFSIDVVFMLIGIILVQRLYNKEM
jgi:hypothetical protein